MTVIFAIMAWFYTYVYYGSERTIESNGESAPLIDDDEDEEDGGEEKKHQQQSDDKESKM